MATELLGEDGTATELVGVLGPWVRKLTNQGLAWASGELLVDGRPVPFEVLPLYYRQVAGILREDEPIVLIGVVDRRPDVPLLSVRGAREPCDCALLLAGDGLVVRCVKPLGHDGLHETPRGTGWADPDDGEEA